MDATSNFVFINFTINSTYIGPTLAAAYLAPIIRKHSYKLQVLNLPYKIEDDLFVKKILSFSPAIVGYSCTENQFQYLVRYSKLLEKFNDILQIAGGVYVTLNPEEVLMKTGVDCVCVGEGEEPLDCLLENIKNHRDIFSIKGFYWKKNGKIIKNSVPPFLNDLTKFGYPDYTVFDKNMVLFDVFDPNFKREKYISCILSRGCPFSCSYCCNEALRSVYPSAKGYWRLPSVDYCIGFLKKLRKQFPETEYIFFVDDMLIINETWFKNFSKSYKKEIKLPYRVHGRPEVITPIMVDSLADSGCDMVSIGLEHGNESYRKKILNREYSNEDFIEKVKMLKEKGIKIFTYTIFGFPFQTRELMKETFLLNKKIGPYFGCSPFMYPYKGTKIYKICKQANVLFKEERYYDISSFYSRPSIRLNIIQSLLCMYYHKRILFFLLLQRYKYTLRTIWHFKSTYKIKLILNVIRFFFVGSFYAFLIFISGPYVSIIEKRKTVHRWKKEWETIISDFKDM